MFVNGAIPRQRLCTIYQKIGLEVLDWEKRVPFVVKVVHEHKGESLNWCKWFDAEHEFPFGKSLLLVQRLIREDYHREELKRAFH